MHQNYLEGSLKQRLLSPSPEISDSVDLGLVAKNFYVKQVST